MNHHQIIFGVVHGINDLIRRQPNVDGVKYCADHRNGKETFEIAGRVPVQHRHRVTRLDACIRQRVG